MREKTGKRDAGFLGEQVPKTLGRILSLSEYSLSPIDSPGKDWEQGFLTAQMRFSAIDKFKKHETNSLSHLFPMTSHDCKGQASSNPNASSSNGNFMIRNIQKPCALLEMRCLLKVVKETENFAIDARGDVLDPLFEPSKSPVDGDGQNGDMSEVCDKREKCQNAWNISLKKQTRLLSLTSPLHLFKHQKSLTRVLLRYQRRPSPISVLEGLFSNLRKMSAQQAADLKLEHESSSADRIPLKASIDDKESVFEYVKAVVQSFGMIISFPTSFVVTRSFSLILSTKFSWRYMGGILVASLGYHCVQSNIRPVLDVKSGICEVWEGVSWHLPPIANASYFGTTCQERYG
ncbi:LOW QUALITY PROTEIN: hypothetical protein NC652_006711 [Populus alba x Populus x berolinensis]|nr:LOW QUALITY PROTEIN: hypothetical protein NC652_006711 [Populus alba x Populus x berolinensis]